MSGILNQCFEQAVSIVSPELKNKLLKIPESVKNQVFDIRLRASKPVVLISKDEKLFLSEDGRCIKNKNGNEVICTAENLNDTFNRVCCYSVHSHLNQLVKGYVTISGGHRVAVAGTAVMNSSGEVVAVKNISSLSIRIAREKTGCSDELLNFILSSGQVRSLIIAGPPCSGKTTLLRDIARNLSERFFNVCIVDERQEIACMNNGFCKMNIGDNADVLDCFEKKDAIEIALRTLSAEVIVVDEVCTYQEIDAIKAGVNSGVKFIVTVHASDFNEIVSRRQIASLISTYSFDKLLLLNKNGEYEIYETRELRDEIIRRRADMAELDTERIIYGDTA